MGGENQPSPGANFALALARFANGDHSGAFEAAEQEGRHFDDTTARAWLVDHLLVDKDLDRLSRLAADNDFAAKFSPRERRDIAICQRDWKAVAALLLPAEYSGASKVLIALGLVTGGVWLILVLRFADARCSLWPYAPPALLLGVLSGYLTIFAKIVIAEEFHLFGDGDVIRNIAYCVAGIGLPEEFFKLLCFLPLAPFLARRQDELSWLIVASLVGLGFGASENLNYFDEVGASTAIGRFATANFLHLALTGMGGLALMRALVFRGPEISQASVVFGMIILLHGTYDAFLMVPELMPYGLLSMTVFVITGQQYFGWLGHLRERWTDPTSVTAIFTVGVIVIVYASLIAGTWIGGPTYAITLTASEITGTALVLFMFYRGIPESVC